MIGLRLQQLIEKTGLKKPTIYAYIKKGILPAPIKFGRASVWIEAEVNDALITRVNERNLKNQRGQK